MNSLLEEIVIHKRTEVNAAKQTRGESDTIEAAKAAPQVRSFRAALEAGVRERGLGLIAECKKASPSKGLLRADFVPEDIARAYAENGAACLSVLTDSRYFQGAPDYLARARQACALPVLRKDFLFDPYQIHEARALHADCVLLILAMLSDAQAAELEETARGYGMDVLVEVHNENELRRALQLSTSLIGINNRDLKTFHTSLEVSERLRAHIPDGRIVISESGIETADDIKRLSGVGIHCALVGESLMRADDIATATRALFPR
ncbi:MAG: indole-3-glycerol phosphate synthase TrpC [Hyphomicrobiales bacterium]|nr:indole-3-glycerol phosphate synthase TrpC [Hyphomicrobiales bacterium]